MAFSLVHQNKMYLSKVHLKNWRVYDDAVFEFKRPTKKKPITLIGAMNGHGKTSFLMALYLGLFGKYGLRHCEGFRHKFAGPEKDDALETMRAAMSQFRRISAPPEEPTEIELIFSPAWSGENFRELRVVRRWFFTSLNKPKQGDSFETLEIHVADDRFADGRPLNFTDLKDANEKLERKLFPAYLTPAFFFDGEQAAELIDSMGDGGLRKAVEVMFGTHLIQETTDRLQSFIKRTSDKGASKRKATELEEQRDLLDQEINDLTQNRAKLEKQRSELVLEKEERESKREEYTRKLASFGGTSVGSVEVLQKAVEDAEKTFTKSRRTLAEGLSTAGLALAVSRFQKVLLGQLEKESLREEWEKVKDATLTRKEAVISHAMPEPAEKDPLVGNLAAHIREKLKQRFLDALDAIYNPPDPRMAKLYVLGHVQGDDARERLRVHITESTQEVGMSLKRDARDYRDAASNLEDVNERFRLIRDQPSEFQTLLQEVEILNGEIQQADVRLGELNSLTESAKNEIDRKKKTLGEVREKLKELGPDQLRVAIADRAKRTLETFSDNLRQISALRLGETVTDIFTQIADRRFKNSKIELDADKTPILRLANNTELHLSAGSGFERRSFSIAFCLALAQITGCRIPLVIDTPVGNAASDYRTRALKTLANFDTDQIIILTHDEEVRLPFLEAIDHQVNQRILVDFDHETGSSHIRPDEFFTFSQ